MTKDYLKFRNAIKKDANLSLEEGYMLETLFDYYNTSLGYAYPSYEVLMADLKTKRKAKVSKLLKALVRKGYIMITKVGKKNTYKLLKYLFLNQPPVDSNGNAPLDGQVHFSEITDEEKEVIDLGFTHKQAKSLLKVAKDKIDKVLKAFNYATQKGAEDLFAYTLWAINNINKIKNTFKPVVENEFKIRKNNFIESCNCICYTDYSSKTLEEKLLGWA